MKLLERAGAEGWELVIILPNNIAYLTKPVELREKPRLLKQRKVSTLTVKK
jgi:hypothetical protein